jgi:hypothetical protein
MMSHMSFEAAAMLMVSTGAGGLVLALVLVKLGVGRQVMGALSKGSRLAVRAITGRFER